MSFTCKEPKLRFPEFRGEWMEKKLGEITSYVDYRGKSPQKVENGIFLVTAKNIKKGYIDYESSKEYVLEKDYNEIMKRGYPHIGDVLLTTEAPLGNVAQIDNENIALAQRVIKFSGNAFLDNTFLKHYFLGDKFQELLASKAIGTTVLGIQGKVLHKLLLNIPSRQEQEKIASFLTAVDAKIEQLTCKEKLLEKYKKSVMQKLFSQELRFTCNDGSAYPEWEEKKLGEVCECLDNLRKPLNDDERQKIKGNIPYWGANNIMDYVNDYLFDETIILLAEDGGNFNEYKTRPIANLSQGKCWVNNHTHVLRGQKNTLNNEFLFYSIVHKNITGYISGGTRAKLTKGEMLKIEINFPSLPEQTKIANFLSAIDEKLLHVKAQTLQAQQFKKALLQQMFV